MMSAKCSDFLSPPHLSAFGSDLQCISAQPPSLRPLFPSDADIMIYLKAPICLICPVGSICMVSPEMKPVCSPLDKAAVEFSGEIGRDHPVSNVVLIVSRMYSFLITRGTRTARAFLEELHMI